MSTGHRDGLVETLAVFDEPAVSGTPFTTSEVATHLDCTHRTAYNRLQRLVENGEIATKKVGARGRVWWRNDVESTDTSRPQPQFETLVDAVEEYAIFLLDVEGHVQTWNSGAERIKGYDRSEILGESITAFYTESDVEAGLPAMLLEMAREAGSVEDEGWRVRKDGSRFWAAVTISALYDETGTHTGFAKVTRDMTPRRDYETRLQRQQTTLNSELDLLFDRIEDGFFALDTDLSVTYANEQFASMVGVSADAIPGNQLCDLDSPIEFLETRHHAERAMRTQQPVEFSYHPDSLDVWYEIRIYPSESGLSVYVRDVTEMRSYEQDLTRTADLLKHAERIAGVGGWELSIDAPPHEAVWTDQLFEIFEIEPRDPLTPEEVLEFVHPADRDRVWDEHHQLLDEQTGREQEYRIVTGAGNVRWLRVVSERPAERSGILRGVTMDVTAQKERERALQHQHEQLAALNHLHSVVERITDAVIEQSTREEIEQTLCEQLATSESYRCVLVGGVDPSGKSLDIRAESGHEDCFDDSQTIPLTTDGDTSNPVAAAARTHDIQVVPDIQTAAAFEANAEQLTPQDCTSMAAIPIVHDGILYGVLSVFSSRSDAFSTAEREVIGALGETVGHAVAAVERKQALMGDDIAELTFRIDDIFETMGTDSLPDERITLDRTVPTGDGTHLLYGTTTGDGDQVVEVLLQFPHWESVDILTRDGDRTRFQARLSDPPLLSVIADYGGHVERVVIEEGDLRFRFTIAAGRGIRDLTDNLQAAYPAARLVSRRQLDRGAATADASGDPLKTLLTDRQRAALETAYYGGFFESPRLRSGGEIADILSITPSTFHQHLRRAEQLVLGAAVGDRTE